MFQLWKTWPTPCSAHGCATDADVYSPTQIPVGWSVGARFVMCSIREFSGAVHPEVSERSAAAGGEGENIDATSEAENIGDEKS